MTKNLSSLVVVAIALSVICAAIVFFTHRALMPTDSELKQIDELVLKAVKSQGEQCTVERLSSPDRVGIEGEIKQGYFTYMAHCSGADKKIRAEWKIENGHIELTSVRPL